MDEKTKKILETVDKVKQEIVGKKFTDALAVIAGNGLTYRILKENDEEYAGTGDYVPERIDLAIKGTMPKMAIYDNVHGTSLDVDTAVVTEVY